MLLAGSVAAQAQNADGDAQPAPEAELPLLEFGLTAGYVRFAHYPGAEDYDEIYGVLPVAIVRSRVLRAGDEEGLRAVLDEDANRGFDIGFGGSWEVDSDDVEIRRGMPDLDYTFQIGPRAWWRIAEGDGYNLTLLAPVRMAFSTDFSSIADRGVIASPTIRWRTEPFSGQGLHAQLALTSRFATERWHDYVYTVQPEYALPERPAYRASGGYIDTSAGAFVRWRRGKLEMYGGGSLSSLAGAANEDSALLRRDFDYTVSAGVTWYLWESAERGYD